MFTYVCTGCVNVDWFAIAASDFMMLPFFKLILVELFIMFSRPLAWEDGVGIVARGVEVNMVTCVDWAERPADPFG